MKMLQDLFRYCMIFIYFNLHTYMIQLDPEELDQNAVNTCSVPQCVVTRNSLSKWRIAAMTLFKFPSYLPMTIHTCSEGERERWIAGKDIIFTYNFICDTKGANGLRATL